MSGNIQEKPQVPWRAGRPPVMEGRPLDKIDKIGFLFMIVGMFMAILDIQIVSSSLSEIQAGLSASQDEISWVQTSYLIAEVIIIPISGWLTQVLSTRIMFFISATTFTLSSAACAMAWNLESMIVFRALQGFLGGAMIPTVFATAFIQFPREKQAMVSVAIGLVATMAPTLGPTLGGWLTATLSWHWLFLINVIPGLLVATVVLFCVNVERPNPGLLKSIDVPGILYVAIFLGTLQYILEEGPGDDWLESRKIAVVALVCLLSGIAFFWRELTTALPVINLRAFSDPNFALGCFYSFIIGIGLYGSVYVVPLYLARINGYNSLQIGKVIMVTGLFQFLSAPVAGAISKHIDLRLMLALGLLFFALGLHMNTGITADWSWDEFFLPQMVRGFSLMFLFIPVNTLALGTLSPQLLKGGSGLYNLMRNLGGAIGLAVINTALSHRYDLHHQHLSELVTAARPVVTQTLGGLEGYFTPVLGSTAPQAALSTVSSLVVQQASVLAFSDVLFLMSLVFVIGFLLIPLMRKVSAHGDGSTEAH